jgi:hypothetical protein
MLGIGTDIKFGKRRVVSRPTLFAKIRQNEVPTVSDTYPAGSPLHETLRSIFNKYVVFDSERYELSPKSALEDLDEINVLRVVRALRQVSATADPPEG